VVYGALIAMVQFDFRKVLAFSSLSHVGLMGAGLLAYSELALEGVVLQMFAHGVNITGLFFVSEIIREQTGTRDVDQMGGLTRTSMPLTVLFFVLLLGSIAVPLTNGFPGEFKFGLHAHPLSEIHAGAGGGAGSAAARRAGSFPGAGPESSGCPGAGSGAVPRFCFTGIRYRGPNPFVCLLRKHADPTISFGFRSGYPLPGFFGYPRT
jgi:hypothetical protein